MAEECLICKGDTVRERFAPPNRAQAGTDCLACGRYVLSAPEAQQVVALLSNVERTHYPR